MNKPTVYYYLFWDKPEDIKKCLMENRRVTENGCWEWTRGKAKGYGHIHIENRTYKVHRVSAWLFLGFNMKNKLLICHDCPGGDNKSCFNPEHLWLGTDKDNVRDMYEKGRIGLRGEKCPTVKLNWNKVHRIRLLLSMNVSRRIISSLFDISEWVVSDIKRNKTWKVQ